MSFSSIALEQREKEIRALKAFLAFSVAGSLVTHVVLLASGIGNLLMRTPLLEEEPIELTFIEPEQTPEPEVKETPLTEPLKEQKIDTSEVLTASSENTNNDNNNSIINNKPLEPVVPPTQVQPTVTTPVKKLVENFQREVVSQKQTVAKVEPQRQIESPKPSQVPEKPVENTPVKSTTPTQTTTEKPRETDTSEVSTSNQQSSQQSSSQLRSLLSQIRDSRSVGESNGSTSNTTGNNSSLSLNSDSSNTRGIGTTESSQNSSQNSGINAAPANLATPSRRRREIAVQPTQPKVPTQIEKPANEAPSESNGSRDGRAACRNCQVKYSDRARRRGAEGRVEVAVDTDDKGNVTNVRLTRSSGDRDLDQEHLRQAREWKLKPSQAGRQDVTIGTEYAIEGSRRHREVRKQQRERQARQRERQEETTATNTSLSRRRRRLEAATTNTVTDVPTNTSRRRRSEANSNSVTTNSDSNRLNRRLRRRTETTVSNSESTSTRRVRSSQSSSLGNRLRRRSGENSTAEAPTRRRRRISADVRVSGQQNTSTRRRRRQLNQSSPSSSTGNRLRDALRRSRSSTPSSEGE